jgi:putative lipoprotein
MIILVGGIIRGRVLLDGDTNKSTRVSQGSKLSVSLQDTSMADAPAINLKQIEISNLFAFPFSYQIDIPANISPALSYSLSARITKDDSLLYINDQHISVQIGNDSPMIIDIPVITVNKGLNYFINDKSKMKESFIDAVEQTSIDQMEQLSWPEMVGQLGTDAVKYIKEKTG